MFKKPLFVAVLLGALLAPSLSMAQVQTPSYATSSELASFKAELTALIMEQIKLLQAQLVEVQAQEAAQASQLNQIHQTVQTPAQTSVQSVSTQPIVATLSDASCQPGKNGSVNPTVSLSVSGATWKQATFLFPSYVLQNNEPRTDLPKRIAGGSLGAGDNTFAFSNFSDTYEVTGNVYADEYQKNLIATFSKTITAVACN